MYHLIKKYKLTAVHLMVIILGFTGVLGKLISLETIHLVWYRMGFSFLSLALFLFFNRQPFTVSKQDFFGILGVGTLVTLHWLCFFESIKISTISVAVVCLSTSSLFSALIEPIFFKRKLLAYEVIMGVIVILALAFVMGTETMYLWGYIYGITSALLGTLFTLFNAKYIKKVGAAQITMIEMLAGVIIISCLLLFQQDFTVFTSSISITDFYYLIILAVLCTSMVFVWMTEIMRYITPYSLIMAINLEPIYSIILALLIFGNNELMSSSFYIGSSVIIGVVFLEGYLKNKQ
ncbi:MAG: EamA family transporter [Flavobacteriales bacterium]|jgi:drug/metabolite transporter (DMT)-like permease|nr:EamA family transporter [Flavobacteriales bacterium]|tara:strand:+ start:1540 stop:2415 length:876 start_codon:yes stop_codon:yes gene_type:complete